MKVDMLQLSSQWANSTGEKGPKNFWEFFFYFHFNILKVLIKPQLPIKEFLQNQWVKKLDQGTLGMSDPLKLDFYI